MKTTSLLILLTVILSGCYVDRYHDRGPAGRDRGYDQRGHDDHDRGHDNRDNHRDGDRDKHDDHH